MGRLQSPPFLLPQEEIKKQIDWLVTNCGITRDKMTSFRAPYLVRSGLRQRGGCSCGC